MDPVSDSELAARIEREAAAMQREYAEAHARLFPHLGAAWIDVAGGVAAVLEPGSMANGAFNIGMDGEVTADQFARLGDFFREHGDTPSVSVCPLAHASLAALVDDTGWTASEFENVLARAIDPAEEFAPPAAGVEWYVARTSDEREQWAELVRTGFAAPEVPTSAELRLARAAAEAPHRLHLIATVDGAPAATGELRIGAGIGWLTADTTLPQFRCRGAQGALQRARLELACDAGCDLAVTESLPGSASERNMERHGFRIVYTRVEARPPQDPTERTDAP
jgi:hypothetical protein